MTTVVVSGRPGGTTHLAVEVLRKLPSELRLIGGLAVMCRVGMPHRATVDLDTLTRGLSQQDPVLAHLAVTSSGGGQYRFDHDLDLDVIDVAPASAEELVASMIADDGELTDLELNVVGHTWAHDHATPLDLVAVDDEAGTRLATAPGRLVASPGGLVAMKVTTVPLRASARPEKRASDLYDLGRLLLTSPDIATELDAMPDVLASTIRRGLAGWFCDPAGRDRTYRSIRRFDDPPLGLDDVADAVEDLATG